MAKDFDGKVAVITGAANGIGKGLVGEALKRGMKVVAADVDVDGLERLLREHEAGDRLEIRPTDVRVYEAVDGLADFAYEKFGVVHLVFNHAGVISTGPVWEEAVAGLDWHIGVNLMGIAYGVKAFVPRLIASGVDATVVNTGSLASFAAARGNGIYAAAKHGVLGLTEALYMDLLAANVRVTAALLLPGGVTSEIARVHRAPAGIVIHRDQKLQDFLNDNYTWMSPAEAAAVAFDGLAEGKFWLFTHPDRKGGGEARMQAMLAGDPPPMREVLG